MSACPECRRLTSAIRSNEAYLAGSARQRSRVTSPGSIARADAAIARDKAVLAEQRNVLAAHIRIDHQEA